MSPISAEDVVFVTEYNQAHKATLMIAQYY